MFTNLKHFVFILLGVLLAFGGTVYAGRTVEESDWNNIVAGKFQSITILGFASDDNSYLKIGAGGLITTTTAPQGGGDMLKSDNLSGLASNTVALNNLGLGTAALRPLTDFLPSSTVVNTPSTTIPTNNNQLTNGSGFITTSTPNFGMVSPLTRATTTLWFDFSIANNWSAVQYFNGGVSSTYTRSNSSTLAGVTTFRGPEVSTGTLDTVSACGTSPSIVGANGNGRVTTGSNASSTCTVTFGTAFTNKPTCNVTSETTSSINYRGVPSATTYVIFTASSSAFKSNVLDYRCRGL